MSTREMGGIERLMWVVLICTFGFVMCYSINQEDDARRKLRQYGFENMKIYYSKLFSSAPVADIQEAAPSVTKLSDNGTRVEQKDVPKQKCFTNEYGKLSYFKEIPCSRVHPRAAKGQDQPNKISHRPFHLGSGKCMDFRTGDEIDCGPSYQPFQSDEEMKRLAGKDDIQRPAPAEPENCTSSTHPVCGGVTQTNLTINRMALQPRCTLNLRLLGQLPADPREWVFCFVDGREVVVAKK